jgi:1,4-dihydroxy-2-naphthoyl-CoA hydrolase
MDVSAAARASHYTGAIDFTIVEQGPERVVARMPVTDGIRNPFGTVHAGAILWFADVTATVLALNATEVKPDGSGFPLALSLNAQLLGNVRDGELTATASFVRRGRRVSVVRTAVTDAAGKLLVDVTTNHMPA